LTGRSSAKTGVGRRARRAATAARDFDQVVELGLQRVALGAEAVPQARVSARS
jgi:hypothetical protein